MNGSNHAYNTPLVDNHWRSVVAGSLSVLVVQAVQADEGADSSVNFVDRETLTANAWAGTVGNPLRSGNSAAVRRDEATTYNADPADDPWVDAKAVQTDEEVRPASYDEQSRGLQLRPYSRPEGLFGSSNNSKPAAPKKSTKMNSPAAGKSAAAARAKAMSNGMTGNGANPKASAGGSQQGLPSLANRAGSRAGSANESGATPASWQSNGRSSTLTNPNAYRTASSAESYQHAGTSGAGTASAGISGQPSLASRGRDASAPSNNAISNKSSGAGLSASAQALANAHKLAESANTEEDFSEVVMACQRIPASQATAEEVAFGKQLASWALNRRGQIHANAGRSKEAIADFDTSVRLDPKRWRAFHNRGVLFAQSGQFEQAFDDFHRTIELNPQFAKAYSNRAALYVVAGQMEPAAHDYEKAVTLDPKLAVAQRGCGRTLHMMGRTNEAMSHLDAAVRLAPNDVASLTSRGDLLTDLGRYAVAAADYDRAVELNSNSAEACRSSAWLLATCPDDSVRNPQLALRRAQMAARLDKKGDAVTFDTLAAAQASAGDFRHAVESMRQAIELAPPSERSVYQDRLQMYRQAMPYRIAPMVGGVQQAGYQQ